MRLVVLMIPIALVGGYVVHSLAHRAPHAAPHVAAPALPIASEAGRLPLHPVPPDAPTALSVPRLALVNAPFETELEAALEKRHVRIRGAASASMRAAIEGALELATQRLAESDTLDAELVAELVTWSASWLADVAADLEGSIEIETSDGERVVIGAGGRPSIRIGSP